MRNNKRANKEEVNRIKQLCLEKSDELSEKYPDRKFSSWEVISMVLAESSGYDVYFLTLKADLEIIKLIAEGLSSSGIANRLSISSQHIYNVAKIWGLDILTTTLDFNPMYVYRVGMSAQELTININDILPIPINENEAKKIINNINKYNEYAEFIEEYEYEEEYEHEKG